MIPDTLYTRLKRIFELHVHPRLLIEDCFSPQLNSGLIEDVYRHLNYTNPFNTDTSYIDSVVALYHRQFDTFCDIADLSDEISHKRSSFSLRLDDVHFTSTFIYNLSKNIRSIPEENEWMDDGHRSSVWLEYLKEYGIGFFEGFISFDDFINKKVSGLGSETRARRIFQFATNNWAQIHEPVIGYYGTPVNGETTGHQYGMLYKAWSTILANQEMFEKLADDYWNIVNSDFEPDPISKPLSNPETDSTASNSSDIKLTKLQAGYVVYYLTETKFYKWSNGSPSKFDWEHFNSIMGTNTDNIRQSYNDLQKSDYRLTSNKKPYLEVAIQFIQSNYPDAQSAKDLALSELELISEN